MIGRVDTSVPGTVNFGGMPDYRTAIALQLAQNIPMMPNWAPRPPMQSSLQPPDEGPPSDPVADPGLGSIIAPAPTSFHTMDQNEVTPPSFNQEDDNVVDPSSLMSQVAPAEINDQGKDVSTNSPHNEAMNAQVQNALNDAIVADPDTGQMMSNSAMNQSVSNALQSAIDAASTGFGTGTGFSSAQAANDAVAGALADAIASSAPGEGEGEGGGEGGGGGDGGGK